MALRVALVTPFAWSQPHDVNEHVAGLAGELRARGHTSPCSRRRTAPATSPRAGARSPSGLADAEFVALGPAVPISRRSRDGRAGRRPREPRRRARRGRLRHRARLRAGPAEPLLPRAPRRRRADGRDVLLAGAARVSARAHARASGCSAGSTRCSRRARRRPTRRPSASPARTSSSRWASTSSSSRPAAKRKVVVLEWRQAERPLLRALARELAAQPDWELVLLRTRPLGVAAAGAARAARPRARAHGARRRGPRRAPARRGGLRPGRRRHRARRARGAAAGAAVASPPGRELQPELAAAEAARLVEDEAFRAQRAARGPRAAAARASTRSPTASSASTRASPPPAPRPRAPRAARGHATGSSSTSTCTRRWSHDCSIEVDELLDHAEAEGLGAIAVTDHNVFGGALEAVERARGRELVVIPGEEVKTDGQGEVIGLFLKEEIPRGISFADTVEAIRAQGGLVYVPHPFDRLHAIPDPATLHRHLAEIDVFEVYNARLLFEAYNDEALALRAQVQPHRGRRLRRARAPGRRHGRRADAPLRRARRSSSSRSEARRSCAARSRSRTSRD